MHVPVDSARDVVANDAALADTFTCYKPEENLNADQRVCPSFLQYSCAMEN